MIDELRAIAIFTETIKRGSFRAAAKSLGLSPSVVSYQVSQLEKKLGTALMYRSTRSLSLTHEGHILFKHGIDILNSAGTAIDKINGQSDVLTGRLVVTLPSALINSQMTKDLAQFKSMHPKLSLTLKYDDDHQDIIEGGIDLAIRAGTLKDSDLKSRSIGAISRVLVCASQYLKTKERPRQLSDVASWDWIGLESLPNQRTFEGPEGQYFNLDYQVNTVVNSVLAHDSIV